MSINNVNVSWQCPTSADLQHFEIMQDFSNIEESYNFSGGTPLHNEKPVEHDNKVPDSLQQKFVSNPQSNDISQDHLTNSISALICSQPFQNITCPLYIHQPILDFYQILDLDSGKVVYPRTNYQKPQQTEPLPTIIAPILYSNPNLEYEKLKIQKHSEVTENILAINSGTSNSSDFKKSRDSYWTYICQKEEKICEKINTADQQVPELNSENGNSFSYPTYTVFNANKPIVQQSLTVANFEASLNITSVSSSLSNSSGTLRDISNTSQKASVVNGNFNVANITSTPQNLINQNDAFWGIQEKKTLPQAIKIPFKIQNNSSKNAVQENFTNESKVTKCNECSRTFYRPCYLVQHIAAHHSGDKPFKCTKCGKKFHDEHSLNLHSQKHVGNKAHKCGKCQKQFHYKADLRRHFTSIHLGKKPFPCSICDKGFMRNDHLAKHLMAVHNKDARKY